MSDLPEGAVELERFTPGQRYATADGFDKALAFEDRPGRIVFVPDPEPEWVPKPGDWYRGKYAPNFSSHHIVDIANGYVVSHCRSIDGAPFPSRHRLHDLVARYEQCDPPGWWTEIDAGQAEVPWVPWAVLQNTIVQALWGFNLGRRTEISGRVATRVAGLLESHGIEPLPEPVLATGRQGLWNWEATP